MKKGDRIVGEPLPEMKNDISHYAGYWFVNKNNEVLFYEPYKSPQCNTDKRIMEMRKDMNNHEILLIPVAYVPKETE